MLIKINITREVLEESKNCRNIKGRSPNLFETKMLVGFNCAISKAINPIFPDAIINYGQIEFYKNSQDFMNYVYEDIIPLPLKATEFIQRFDLKTPEQRAAMQPISFTIEVPDSVIDRVGLQQVNEILSKSETLSHAI